MMKKRSMSTHNCSNPNDKADFIQLEEENEDVNKCLLLHLD